MSISDIYKQVRKEIMDEYTLMSNRVGWTLAGHAFLFTALILGHKLSLNVCTLNMSDKFKALHDSIFYPLIPAFALMLSTGVFFGVFAAISRISEWEVRAEHVLKFANTPSTSQCQIIARSNQKYIHIMGLIPPIVITSTSIATWVLIIFGQFERQDHPLNFYPAAFYNATHISIITYYSAAFLVTWALISVNRLRIRKTYDAETTFNKAEIAISCTALATLAIIDPCTTYLLSLIFLVFLSMCINFSTCNTTKLPDITITS